MPELKKQIISYLYENYKFDEKIPSENWFSLKYDVSRTTIRLILLGLKARNIIYSKKGSGHFLSEFPIEQLSSFSKKDKSNYKLHETEIDPLLLKYFPTKTKNYNYKSAKVIRSINGQIISVDFSFLNNDLLLGISEENIKSGILNFIKTNSFKNLRAKKIAIMAKPYEEVTQILGIDDKTIPVVLSLILNENSEALEVSISWRRPERFISTYQKTINF